MKYYMLACTLSTAMAQMPSRLPAPGAIHYSGVVVDATSGRPIPGATVATTFKLPAAVTAVSDRAGRFAIDAPYPGGEPPDRMRPPLAVSAPGYYEAPDASYPGEWSQDANGDVRVMHVIRRLTAWSGIAGDVLDAAGNPAQGAKVSLMAVGLQASGKDETADAKGHFRMQVPPGSYLVCAEPSGDEGLGACYPSAATFAAATVVTIRPGEGAGPITIQLKDEPKYGIRGRIETLVAKAPTWGESVTAIPVPPEEAGPQRFWPGHECVNRDGSFLITGLRAGRYVIAASAGPQVRRNDCSPPKERNFGLIEFDDCCGPPRPRAPEYHNSEMVALSRDIQGLVVKVGHGARITGRVMVDGEGADASGQQVLTLRPWYAEAWEYGGAVAIKPDAGGNFQVEEAEPGLYRVQDAAPLYVSKLVQDGKPRADGSVDLRMGASTAIEITLRKPSAMLHVEILRDTTTASDPPFRVVAIPEDPARRAGMDRTLPDMRANSNDATLGPLPPGSYLVLASSEDGWAVRWLAILGVKRLAEFGVRVELRDGTTESVKLKPLPPEMGPQAAR